MSQLTQIQIRRDTAANWTSANPILAQGEWGLEMDTGLQKTGDGATAWNALPYKTYEVNLYRFGAKCDGSTDDTNAVKAAIAYALSFTSPLVNNQSLIPIIIVPGMTKISPGQINIDRPANQTNNLIIRGAGVVGGFICPTAGIYFNTTLGTEQATNQIRFENITFSGLTGVSGTYVCAAAAFVRVQWLGCYFNYIQFANCPGTSGTSGFIQSHNFQNCLIRAAQGPWLTCTDLIDFTMQGCEFEGNIGQIITATGTVSSFRFDNNMAESNTSGILYFNILYDANLEGNYIEANGALFLLVAGPTFSCNAKSNHFYSSNNGEFTMNGPVYGFDGGGNFFSGTGRLYVTTCAIPKPIMRIADANVRSSFNGYVSGTTLTWTSNAPGWSSNITVGDYLYVANAPLGTTIISGSYPTFTLSNNCGTIGSSGSPVAMNTGNNNNIANLFPVNQLYGEQQTVMGRQTGTGYVGQDLENMAYARFFKTDARSFTTNSAVPFCTITFGAGNATASVKVTCAGVVTGSDTVSSASEWAITQHNTSAITITSLSQQIAGVAGVSIAQSGQVVTLSYTAANTSQTNYFNTAIEVQAVSTNVGGTAASSNTIAVTIL